MAPANSAGPTDRTCPHRNPADADQLRKRIADGEWVVDLRNRVAFAAGHLPGTLNFGLDGSFATYLGWLIPWGTPLTLLAETPDQIAQAQRELVRIGIDRPAAHATGTPPQWAGGEDLATIPRATFADLALVRHHRPVTVLDTRRNLERRTARTSRRPAHPLHDLPRRLDDVPGGEIWVHCAAGYRASIAASCSPAPADTSSPSTTSSTRLATAGLPIVPGAQDPVPGHSSSPS
jgi:hydroxyacylglutathione hydrolase